MCVLCVCAGIFVCVRAWTYKCMCVVVYACVFYACVLIECILCVCVCLLSLQHEMASVKMFDHLVTVNGLESVMQEHGLTLPDDLVFIKEQIAGPLESPVSTRKGQDPVSYHGNPVRKNTKKWFCAISLCPKLHNYFI